MEQLQLVPRTEAEQKSMDVALRFMGKRWWESRDTIVPCLERRVTGPDGSKYIYWVSSYSDVNLFDFNFVRAFKLIFDSHDKRTHYEAFFKCQTLEVGKDWIDMDISCIKNTITISRRDLDGYRIGISRKALENLLFTLYRRIGTGVNFVE